MTVSIDQFSQTLEHLQQELSTLRTGRATPALVEHLSVEAYSTKTPLRELASISTPEPQSLVIQPWDVNILKDIERAIQESSLGVQPLNDGQVLRLVMPPLTEERRNDLLKVVRQKGEEAKIAVRSIREKIMKTIKAGEASGDISEDDATREQKEAQQAVDEAIRQIGEIIKTKEDDIQKT